MAKDDTIRFRPESSNVVEVIYNVPTGNLIVEFKGNRKYLYYGVPENVFQHLQNAESAGKFINGNIVGVYTEEKLKELQWRLRQKQLMLDGPKTILRK